ncbi:MAG TPA: class I SAM-dependent methyltransferase [Thermoanaerobaculia bacterium]|nr:class I SAM-dependent methyltransferase [Thermoanaerobaculia bacterium]
MRFACRICGRALTYTFVDLGMTPLANSYLDADQLDAMEPFYPLHVRVCEGCFLVQLPELRSPAEIFEEYVYFSSFSESWLEHGRRYSEAMIERFGLGPASRVIEVASNDGYLLRHFRDRGIGVLGIEPARNVAEAANAAGIPTLPRFFGVALARELVAKSTRADLLAGNNVLAHVPDLHDFVGGLEILLAEGGVLTVEFPHLLRLMKENQFDTIYHEHFSYLSFRVVVALFAGHALTVFDVEELPTHGGSLRIFARRAADGRFPVRPGVAELLAREEAEGLGSIETYGKFEARVAGTKAQLLEFLLDARSRGKSVAGYGAPAKGNTLLNFCGVRSDFLPFTVDRSPYKQGRFLPGTHIPIYPPERIFETRPDYVLILPWNLREEIAEQMSRIGEWGGKFVVAIPRIQTF